MINMINTRCTTKTKIFSLNNVKSNQCPNVVQIKPLCFRMSSRLEISRSGAEDEGIYTCVVRNALGTSYKDVDVTVAGLEAPMVPHALQCSVGESEWCLNGGTCYRVEDLDNRFCV